MLASYAVTIPNHMNFSPYFRHIVFSLILLVLLDTKMLLTLSTYTAFFPLIVVMACCKY